MIGLATYYRHRAPARWRHTSHRLCRPWLWRDTSTSSRWLALLDAENVQTFVLNRREDRDLLWSLLRSRKWFVDFRDRQSVILSRVSV